MANDTQDIIVIGGGVAGLATAYFLLRAGLDVHVLERLDGPGLETSFANGGMLTPSMSDPWNAPGVHRDLMRYLGRADAPMLLRLSALQHYVGWGLQFLAHSSPARHAAAMEANFALSALSLAAMRALRADCVPRYALGMKGTMKVFRDPTSFAVARARSERLRDLGLAFDVLDPDGVARAEPLLADIRGALAGGIHYPADETGDAYQFCRELRRVLEQRGVRFSFGTEARRVRVERGRVVAVETRQRVLSCDRVVVAAAAWSPALLAPLGVKIRVRPVKGYSLSVPMRSPERNLSLAIVDDGLHAAATPLGDTLRLAGTAEFAGWNRTLDPGRLAGLWKLLKALGATLEAAVDRERATPWCGFRPMSANGRPCIGRTPVKGLYVNCGHGHLGWTQAAGSGELLAQIVTGATPAISPLPYAIPG